MNQKQIFLNGEGDFWYLRNQNTLKNKNYNNDLISNVIKKIFLFDTNIKSILEVGCGDGGRLKYLHDLYGIEINGIDPSDKAIKVAKSIGVNAVQATADSLPFSTKSIDVLIFGFCLYLCDRDDLFKIAAEAGRVLRDDGWIIILDFYTETPTKNPYHHHPGVFSYKMDYSSLFSWHPNYSLFSHEVLHHSEKSFTDITEEHIAVSVLRKKVK